MLLRVVYNIIPYYIKKFELITYDGRGCRIILYCIPLFHIIVGVPLYYSYILSIQKEIY